MSSAPSSPVGVFGGTFDPIHFAHLRLAEELGESLALAQVRLVPARVPPHRGDPSVGPEDRLHMVRLAAQSNSRLVVDDRELRREGPSYSVDTLTELRAELGPRPLCLMLGADAFAALMTWSRWRQLFDLAHLIVATRPGYPLVLDSLPEPLRTLARARQATAPGPAPAGSVVTREISALDISASDIRERLKQGRSVRYLIPDSVLDYIRERRLYRGPHGG